MHVYALDYANATNFPPGMICIERGKSKNVVNSNEPPSLPALNNHYCKTIHTILLCLRHSQRDNRLI